MNRFEQGLYQYNQIHAELRVLERQMTDAAIRGEDNSKYVHRINNLVNQLEVIEKQYGL